MNVDDLRARMAVATASWRPGPPKALPSGAAVGVHNRLAAIALSAASSPKATERLRRLLLTEIDQTTGALLGLGMACVRELRDARGMYAYEACDSSGNVTVERFGIDEVPPTSSALLVFRAAQSLRQRVPPKQQIGVVHMLALEAELTATEAGLAAAVLADASAGEVSRLQRDVALVREAMQQGSAKLQRAALSWLEAKQNYVSSLAWTTWTLPVALSPDSSDAEVLAAADGLERLSHAMYRPLPIDSSIPTEQLKAIERGWSIYEDCGTAWAVMAVWLRCIAATDESRRCNICYRHLGSGMRRYCSVHTRTAKKRQKSRDLHVASLYRTSAQAFLQSGAGGLLEAGARIFHPTDISDLCSVAKGCDVPEPLVVPAATLSAILRELLPVLEPSLQDLAKLHFIRLLSLARTPFDREPAGDFMERVTSSRQRHAAPKWLCLEVFVETWFCSDVVIPWTDNVILGEGLDADHPIRASRSVLPSKLVIDLSFMRCWKLVGTLFDENAYLNFQSVAALRSRRDGKLDHPPSLAAIGAILGVSPEAVRKTLRHMDDPGSVASRRARVLPSGLRRVEQLLVGGIDGDSSE